MDLLVGGVAIIMICIGGVIGTGSSAAIALIVVGIVLVGVAWIPALNNRYATNGQRRTASSTPDEDAVAADVGSNWAARAVQAVGKWTRGEI
jgi:O-antigen ligase